MNLTITTDTVHSMTFNNQRVDYLYYGNDLVWPKHDYSQDNLTIESLEDGNTITVYIPDRLSSVIYNMKYSYDNETWADMTLPSSSSSNNYTTNTFNLDTNDKLYIKGNARTWSWSYLSDPAWGSRYQYTHINSTKQFKVSGNLNSLFNGSNTLPKAYYRPDASNPYYDNHLKRLFYGATHLVDASNLIFPFTNLTARCWNDGITEVNLYPESFKEMFAGCTSLVTPPYELRYCGPSTHIQMFYGCSSMTKSPVLSSQTIYASSYEQMFAYCTSLIEIICLALDNQYGTSDWHTNVPNSGTFYKNANTSWTTGLDGVPNGWTVQNYN